MKGLRGLISETKLKELKRSAIIMALSGGYCGLVTSLLALKECHEEIGRYQEYISSGKAGKYGRIKKATRNWDTEIPPMGYKSDHLTEI